MVQLKNISVDYGQGVVLDVNALNIPPQKMVAIVGPNGGGKSTCIRVISGEIEVKGSVSVPASSVCTLPQDACERSDFPLTVIEYIAAGLLPEVGAFRPVTKKHIAHLESTLESVCLLEHRDKMLNQLSGGEWQRVQLARLLLLDKPVMVLDEPFSAVDQKVSKILMGRFQALREQGKTVIVVTHDLAAVTAFFDWVVVLSRKVVGEGPPKEVITPSLLEILYSVRSDVQ